MTRFLAGALVVLSLPTFAQAAVYRWTDAEGTTHYTNNPTEVPKGVTVFATDGDPISNVGANKSPEKEVAAVAPPSLATAGDRERYWRGAFRELNLKIRSLEDEITLDSRKVDTINGLPVNARYNCPTPYLVGSTAAGKPSTLVAPRIYGVPNLVLGCGAVTDPEVQAAQERLPRNKLALTRAKEDLQELERQASFEAVPREWRR